MIDIKKYKMTFKKNNDLVYKTNKKEIEDIQKKIDYLISKYKIKENIKIENIIENVLISGLYKYENNDYFINIVEDV